MSTTELTVALASLKGTEAQVRWANKIRAVLATASTPAFVDKYIAAITKPGEEAFEASNAAAATLKTYLAHFLKTKDSASWWIDNREYCHNPVVFFEKATVQIVNHTKEALKNSAGSHKAELETTLNRIQNARNTWLDFHAFDSEYRYHGMGDKLNARLEEAFGIKSEIVTELFEEFKRQHGVIDTGKGFVILPDGEKQLTTATVNSLAQIACEKWPQYHADKLEAYRMGHCNLDSRNLGDLCGDLYREFLNTVDEDIEDFKRAQTARIREAALVLIEQAYPGRDWSIVCIRAEDQS